MRSRTPTLRNATLTWRQHTPTATFRSHGQPSRFGRMTTDEPLHGPERKSYAPQRARNPLLYFSSSRETETLSFTKEKNLPLSDADATKIRRGDTCAKQRELPQTEVFLVFSCSRCRGRVRVSSGLRSSSVFPYPILLGRAPSRFRPFWLRNGIFILPFVLFPLSRSS